MRKPSLLLVHGALTGAWVWDFWRDRLRGLHWDVDVLDLRGHGRSLPMDMSMVTMEDYASDLESVVHQIGARKGGAPVVGGWDMGGLVAQMLACRYELPALLLIASSPPLEVAGKAPPEVVRQTPAGEFGPELLGITAGSAPFQPMFRGLSRQEAEAFTANLAGARESGLAQRQRLRGVSIPAGAIRCPVLVVYGDSDQQQTPETSRRLSNHLAADEILVAGADHTSIVYSEATVANVARQVGDWLESKLAAPLAGGEK